MSCPMPNAPCPMRAYPWRIRTSTSLVHMGRKRTCDWPQTKAEDAIGHQWHEWHTDLDRQQYENVTLIGAERNLNVPTIHRSYRDQDQNQDQVFTVPHLLCGLAAERKSRPLGLSSPSAMPVRLTLPESNFVLVIIIVAFGCFSSRPSAEAQHRMEEEYNNNI
ncbi:GL12470 [Drosophila persimilis]|uniref:GL12470 n=1 Tax=Drosophila persimilis TaxID=7234 RepID=B4GMZ0_DROPE|nr:GL12470 [Drosophila persimilis]